MAQLNKITPFDRRLPAASLNDLIDSEARRRLTLATIDDQRKPKNKSPVIVQLLWDGESAIEPGHCVKLGAVAIDPTVDETAPFAGLAFHCDEFSGAETLVNYAITLGEIAGGGAGVGFGYMPLATWAKVDVTDAGHTRAVISSAGTLLASAQTGGQRIIWKPAATGEQWCVVSIGGIGDHYQVIRGQTTAAVADTDETFTIDGVTAYEQFAATPTEPVTVQVPPGGVTLTDGQTIWAIYRESVGGVGVDWLMLDFGATNTPPLRRFVLTANKTLAQNTATVKWLDDAGAPIGSDVTIHDPGYDFSGRIADGLYTGSPAFTGEALLRTDLGGVQPDRWEITRMKRCAEEIVIYKYATDTYKYSSNLSLFDDTWRIAPAEADDVMTYIDDPASMLTSLPVDTKIVARLSNPDTTPPTYEVVGVPDHDRKVAADGSDTTPGLLVDKLVDGGNYNSETDLIAKIDVVDDAGTRKIQISYTPGEGAGVGELISVYIDHSIDAATEVGLSSFDPGISTVELYELNEETGRYSRGAPVEVENHDVKTALTVESASKPLRGLATKNAYGKYVLHTQFCEPISQ